ncbi:MAG: hypothetical protein V4760_03845 [Bdellovibrionota bacterium]
MKLDLSQGNPESPARSTTKMPAKPETRPATKPAHTARPTTDYQPRQQRASFVDEDADTSPGRAPRGEPREEVSLNVLFNWNGHTWDAYEVLGLPAGSSRAKVEQAFVAARSKADSDSLPFLKAAHDAIIRS